MGFDVSIVGFGDNVVDRYEHLGVMYPGGNAANVAVYARWLGAARGLHGHLRHGRGGGARDREP